MKINDSITIDPAEIDIRFSCSGGPGGQNVNKVATKATLVWSIHDSKSISDGARSKLLARLPNSHLGKTGVLSVSSSTERKQGQNRKEAERKFAALIRAALVERKGRKATKPTRASKERRLRDKKVRGKVKKLRQERF
jgi:ribosome-associated protein